MAEERISEQPVRTKAVLVDPGSMSVEWMNEPVSAGLTGEPITAPGDTPLSELVPAMPGSSAAEIVRAVADTGIPRHLRADVVSTGKGTLSMVTSIYRIPYGRVLVLTDTTWLLDKERATRRRSSDSRRRR